MARQFTESSSQYLEGSPPVTSVPLTMACWFYADDTTLNHVLMALSVVGGLDRFTLTANGATTDVINAAAANAGAAVAVSSASFSAGTWHHAAGVFNSSTSRTAYLDGGNSGTNTTSLTPTGIDVFHIGARYTTTLAGFPNARIAEACVYNSALTAEQIAILAKGVSPLLVAPESLASYWPLIGRNSPEIDIVGGYGLTLNNSPTTGDHCRVFYPRKEIISPRGKVRTASGAATAAFSQTGLLTGSGALAGTTSATFSQAGAITGAGALAGTTSATFSGTGALTGSGSLTGAADVVFSQSGALSGAGALSGSATVTFSQSGSLVADGPLAGTSAVTFSSSGTLTGSGALTGSSGVTFSESGALAGAGALAGSAAIAFTTSGTTDQPAVGPDPLPQVETTFTSPGFAALAGGTGAAYDARLAALYTSAKLDQLNEEDEEDLIQILSLYFMMH